MEPIIKSKEKCLHCIYGVTGECEMYDDFGLPEDGEKCYNYEEASEEEMAEGQRIAEGEDIKIEDCIGFLKAQSEEQHIDSPKHTLYNKSVEYLNKLQEQHKEDEMWMDVVQRENKFWKAFWDYINDEAIGDKQRIIDAVCNSSHNELIGYVEVTKSINDKQEIIIEFADDRGDKHKAEWQPSDNYACWQTGGMMGDDYTGYLLFPTYKDNRYFCIWYSC